MRVVAIGRPAVAVGAMREAMCPKARKSAVVGREALQPDHVIPDVTALMLIFNIQDVFPQLLKRVPLSVSIAQSMSCILVSSPDLIFSNICSLAIVSFSSLIVFVRSTFNARIE